MMTQNIRGKVLIPLTLTFLILVGAFLFASYRIRKTEALEQLSYRYQSVQNIYKSLLVHQTEVLVSTAEFIGDKRLFQKAMHEMDREALQNHGEALYERLSKRLRITHFYFHDEQGQVFLRLYQPECISGGVRRLTMSQAMATGQPAAGLELGRLGTFALRLVFPWHVDGKLLGYIELGMEIDHILKELKEMSGIDFIVTIDKDFLERESWEEGMTLMGRDGNWDFLPGKVINDSTLPVPREAVAPILNHSIYQIYEEPLKILGRTYQAGLFPLLDAGHRPVGDFLVLADTTVQALAFRGFLSRTGAFSLLLCAGLFWSSYRTLGGVDRQLSETQERLQRESAIQAETNHQLNVEVAERRRAQMELLGLNDHLEQRVAERTRELKQLNQEIEDNRRALEAAYKELQDKQATILHQDKMACIGQLAAGVAHDINNPVGFVSSNLKTLERYLGRLTGYIAILEASIQSSCMPQKCMQALEKRRELKIDHHLQDLPELVADCLEGTERVGKIVRNLRSFARNDAPERHQTDLRECLESTITIIANELRHKATVIREYGDIPLLFCDPQQLNQVFMNLLINASQAIERKGEIRIRTWSEDNAVCVSISDTGCGIPSEKQSKIFEPFFTTKDVGQGTGLGLSIVYDLIRRHDGEIAVKSQPGQGSVFTLCLPLGEEAAQHG